VPYANEHACRLADPAKYDKMRRQNNAGKVKGRRVDHIIGIRDGKSERQAIRYPLSAGWNGKDATRQARDHCNNRGGSFEQARNQENTVADELRWQGVIAIEGEPTGDGRMMEEGSLRWDDGPWPLLWSRSDGGHEQDAEQREAHPAQEGRHRPLRPRLRRPVPGLRRGRRPRRVLIRPAAVGLNREQ